MATISENLQIIKNSTDAIKQAIIDKGGNIEGDITTWASVISGIETSGGSSGEVQPTGNLILNKLNGATIGDPNTLYSLETLLHSYQFNTGITQIINVAVINDAFPSNLLDKDTSWVNAESTRLAPPYMSELCFGAYITKTTDYKNIIGLDLTVYHFGDHLNEVIGNASKFIVIVFGENGTFDYDIGILHVTDTYCYIKDTNISLSNGIAKKVQDINYNDELLVWNFDEGKFDRAKPLWIKKEEKTHNYYKVTLDNGNTICLVGSNGRCHRLFDYDNMIFESATELVDKNVYTLNGIHKIISVENVNETVEYYNIITDFHMNCFANGMLTSCRYNNLYPIKNMVFDKSTVSLEPRWKIHQEKFKPHPEILPKYVKGMRLDENTTMTIDEIKEYITNLENKRKTILDFNSNEILNNIEDTEVGWIDRNGNAYGFKHYMPGQYNHVILSDKICKELNIQTDNPSRYLEKLGWVKYTTDFILNSDDEYINKKQLNTIKKFLNIPGKCKKEGFIKIGTAFDDYTSISDFEKMDEYSFEFRKKNNKRINRVW